MAVILGRKPGGSGGGGGGAPSGPAGGSLSGTYPNPTLGANSVGTSQVANGSITAAKLASGVGSPWTNSFTETGASLSNWTQVSGSWSVVSGAFHVDTTGGTAARLKFNTSQGAAQAGLWCMSVDVMMETASVGTDAPMGILFWWPGVTTGSPTAQIFKAGAGAGTKQIRGELDASAAILSAFTPATTWAFDVYSTLKIVYLGNAAQIVLAGKLTAQMAFTNSTMNSKSFTADPFVGLVANNCNANFKNIRLDYMALPS